MSCSAPPPPPGPPGGGRDPFKSSSGNCSKSTTTTTSTTKGSGSSSNTRKRTRRVLDEITPEVMANGPGLEWEDNGERANPRMEERAMEIERSQGEATATIGGEVVAGGAGGGGGGGERRTRARRRNGNGTGEQREVRRSPRRARTVDVVGENGSRNSNITRGGRNNVRGGSSRGTNNNNNNGQGDGTQLGGNNTINSSNNNNNNSGGSGPGASQQPTPTPTPTLASLTSPALSTIPLATPAPSNQTLTLRNNNINAQHRALGLGIPSARNPNNTIANRRRTNFTRHATIGAFGFESARLPTLVDMGENGNASRNRQNGENENQEGSDGMDLDLDGEMDRDDFVMAWRGEQMRSRRRDQENANRGMRPRLTRAATVPSILDTGRQLASLIDPETIRRDEDELHERLQRAAQRSPIPTLPSIPTSPSDDGDASASNFSWSTRSRQSSVGSWSEWPASPTTTVDSGGIDFHESPEPVITFLENDGPAQRTRGAIRSNNQSVDINSAPQSSSTSSSPSSSPSSNPDVEPQTSPSRNLRPRIDGRVPRTPTSNRTTHLNLTTAASACPNPSRSHRDPTPDEFVELVRSFEENEARDAARTAQINGMNRAAGRRVIMTTATAGSLERTASWNSYRARAGSSSTNASANSAAGEGENARPEGSSPNKKRRTGLRA